MTLGTGEDTIYAIMPGLGYSEIAIILVVALIVIGPRKLPQLMRDFGKIMAYLRKTSNDLRREILFSDEIMDFKRSIRGMVDPPAPPAIPPKFKLKPKDEAGEQAPPSIPGPEVSSLEDAASEAPSPIVTGGDGPDDR